MTKSVSKFGVTIPELSDVIHKYGCGFGDSPPYVVVGQYNSPTNGPIAGILAVAPNQFFAYLIWREASKNGQISVRRSEYHPQSNFSIKIYKNTIKTKIDAQKISSEKEKLNQQRIEKYPRPRIVAWSGNSQERKT